MASTYLVIMKIARLRIPALWPTVMCVTSGLQEAGGSVGRNVNECPFGTGTDWERQLGFQRV